METKNSDDTSFNYFSIFKRIFRKHFFFFFLNPAVIKSISENHYLKRTIANATISEMLILCRFLANTFTSTSTTRLSYLKTSLKVTCHVYG